MEGFYAVLVLEMPSSRTLNDRESLNVKNNIINLVCPATDDT